MKTAHPANIYHGTAFLTLFLAVISLAIFGWGILGLMGNAVANKLVAVVASLIPFAWATALVIRYYPRRKLVFTLIMVLGLILITLSRFLEMPLFSRIVYPVFHSTAGVAVISIPILVVKNGLARKSLLWVAVGGALISTGGISLAFLSSGRQLLFFSKDVVLSIMAPLLLVTSAAYAWGLIKGEKD